MKIDTCCLIVCSLYVQFFWAAKLIILVWKRRRMGTMGRGFSVIVCGCMNYFIVGSDGKCYGNCHNLLIFITSEYFLTSRMNHQLLKQDP